MSNELPTHLRSYLNKNSTQAFIKAAKVYLQYCENLVETGKGNVLEELHPILVDLHYTGYHLEFLEGAWPKEWSEFNHVTSEYFDKLTNTLEKLIEPMLRYNFIADPFSMSPQTHHFFVVEFFTDLYNSLKNEISIIEEPGTESDTEANIRFLKSGFLNHWGHECAVLIEALYYPLEFRRERFSGVPLPFSLNTRSQN